MHSQHIEELICTSGISNVVPFFFWRSRGKKLVIFLWNQESHNNYNYHECGTEIYVDILGDWPYYSNCTTVVSVLCCWKDTKIVFLPCSEFRIWSGVQKGLAEFRHKQWLSFKLFFSFNFRIQLFLKKIFFPQYRYFTATKESPTQLHVYRLVAVNNFMIIFFMIIFVCTESLWPALALYKHAATTLSVCLSVCLRVCMGHGKPGKSWNFIISFSRPGKSWNLGVGHEKSWKVSMLSMNERQ